MYLSNKLLIFSKFKVELFSCPTRLQSHTIKAVRYEGFRDVHDLFEDFVRFDSVMLLKGLPFVHLISHELVAHGKRHLEQIVLFHWNIFLSSFDFTKATLDNIILEFLEFLLLASSLLFDLFQCCLNVIRNYVNFLFLSGDVFISRTFTMVYW